MFTAAALQEETVKPRGQRAGPLPKVGFTGSDEDGGDKNEHRSEPSEQ
jgi:hypothetical protein